MLLLGNMGTSGNYTSYSLGINGLMIDIDNLAAMPAADDFEFKIGNVSSSSNWLPVEVLPTITVRTGAGVNNSDRVTLIWPDNSIENQWLEVTVLDTDKTDLPAPDVFYVVNAIGESENNEMNAFVDGSDFAGARDNPHNFINRANVEDRFACNRDSFVDGTDHAISRDNATNFLTGLKLISLPAATGASLVRSSSQISMLPLAELINWSQHSQIEWNLACKLTARIEWNSARSSSLPRARLG